MNIVRTTDENILHECAVLMCQSSPFKELEFDLQMCEGAMRGDYKDVYVAVHEGRMVGFVVVQKYGVLRGYIQTICVQPEQRGKKIGTSLIQFAEELLLKEFPNVFICVTSFNLRAQKLYFSLGYEKIGELKDHIIRGADEWILRKQKCSIREFKK